MDKISKREKLKIDYKFMTLFYKKLHRKKRKPETLSKQYKWPSGLSDIF